VLLFVSPSTDRGLVMVTHNYVKKTDGDATAGSTNFACNVQAGVNLYMYNNVFWSNSAISTHRDLRWAGATLIDKNKNVMVSNRADGTGYNTTGDMDATARTDAQTYTLATYNTTTHEITGGGYSSGSLLNAGVDVRATVKSFGSHRNLLGDLLDSTPNVGPI
jgi:hypothetical protein